MDKVKHKAFFPQGMIFVAHQI